MYMTGKIDSATVSGDTLVPKGTATVTGLGAGSNQRLVAVATEGGPGATLQLKVSA